MDSIVGQMFDNYELRTKDDYVNAMKEVVQEIALSALAGSDFFDHAAFYGGTALRIFYGMNRYSEDLDFSLMRKESFQIGNYFKVLEETFSSLGMTFKVHSKEKDEDSTIQSAFLKGNTLEHLILIGVGPEISQRIQRNEVLKIKFEIDVEPPAFASYDFKYRLLPSPYRVRLYDKGSLFAGKLHAVLVRNWKNRFKGRDLYDYLFYIAMNTMPNLEHLKARLVESGKWCESEPLGMEDLHALLSRRFDEIDFLDAKKDVVNFIGNPMELDLWSKEFFEDVTDSFFQRNA